MSDENETTIDIAYLEAYSSLFHLLSQTLYVPSDELVVSLQEGELALALSTMLGALEDAELSATLEKLQVYGDAVAHEDSAALRLALEVEYNQLFVGPGKPLTSPYESSYFDAPDGNRRYMTHVGRDVERAYLQAGFATDAAFKDLPDHISAELSFIASLALRAAASLDAGDLSKTEADLDSIEEFIDNHLSKWTAELASTVEAAANSTFYPIITRLVHRVVHNNA